MCVFRCVPVALVLLYSVVAKGDVNEVRERWQGTTADLLDGHYHYRVHITTSINDPSVLAEGKARFIYCPDAEWEIGRFQKRLKFKVKNRHPAEDGMEAFVYRAAWYFDGSGTYLFHNDDSENPESSSECKVYSADFDERYLADHAGPSIDPLADVLGLPVRIIHWDLSIPRAMEAAFSLDAALSGSGYGILNESASTVTLSLPGKDEIELSKAHSYQIASRTWTSEDERVVIINSGWQRFGEQWCPDTSKVEYFDLAGKRKFLVNYRFEVLKKLTIDDFGPFTVRGGGTITLRNPSDTSVIVTLEPDQSVDVRAAAVGEVDLNELLLHNIALSERQLPMKLIIWGIPLMISGVAAFLFYRSRSAAKKLLEKDSPAKS